MRLDRRILVPLDFSPASRKALDGGMKLSERLDAALVVLPVGPDGPMGDLMVQERGECRWLPAPHGDGTGDLADQICRVAAQIGAESIVVPSADAPGSIVAGVVMAIKARAPCAVLVVSEEAPA